MLFVHNLEEKITYTFTVKAQTIGYGTAVSGNVTTGPQQGAPERVSDLSLSFTISAVKLSWRNGNSGKSPILGYYIESRRKGKQKTNLIPFDNSIVRPIIKQILVHIRLNDLSNNLH